MTMRIDDGGTAIRARSPRQGVDVPEPTPIDGRRNASSQAPIQPGNGSGSLAVQVEVLYSEGGVEIQRRAHVETAADGQPLLDADGQPQVLMQDVFVVATNEADDIVVHDVQANSDGGRTLSLNVNGEPFEVTLGEEQGLVLAAGGGNDRILVEPAVAQVLEEEAFLQVLGGDGDADYIWTTEGMTPLGVELAGAVPMTDVSVLASGINTDGEPATEFPSGPFASAEEAALAALDYANPLSIEQNREYLGVIYRDPDSGQYYATPPVVGEALEVPYDVATSIQIPSDAEAVAWFHTHAAEGSPMFSERDFVFSEEVTIGLDAYVATPQGVVLKYDYTA